MHELALCESIIQTLEEQAVLNSYQTVETVWLEVGPLAGVELEALRFGFEVARRGTIADQAHLEIIETEPRARCLSCNRELTIENRFDACPVCGGYQLLITGGEELRIKELEVQ